MSVCEWDYFEGDDTAVVYDLTTARQECGTEHPRGVICTRLLGHTGRHAAGDGDLIVAVWS